MSAYETSARKQDDVSDPAAATRYLREFWQAVQGDPAHLTQAHFSSEGALPSAFAVTDFASAAIGSAGLALAELLSLAWGQWPSVSVERRLASFWFGTSLRPQGWALPPQWDSVAGDYRTADGWIRLHTNAPHHRDAALAVLEAPAERDAVARAVARWHATELESAIVDRNGCAAAMRGIQAWNDHPQGRAVNAEPLLHRVLAGDAKVAKWPLHCERPLQGIRVLDLTRILAGPVATRFLAGYGAQVLRIDPYGWEEPVTVPEVVLGKRCARLDLKRTDDLDTLKRLLADADVLVHGYRPEALAGLGLDAAQRRAINPALIDVSLDAYGWSGPWRGRRGFDSLVQMSSGIADAGMRAAGRDTPTPLPVQALDHATGYLMAAAAIRGLIQRLTTGAGSEVRASLARTAHLLIAPPGDVSPRGVGQPAPLAAEQADDLSGGALEQTAWGPARRIAVPLSIAGTRMHWDHPAAALGSSGAAWG